MVCTLLSAAHAISFISTAVMENNLSVPLYGTDGLWLQHPIYLCFESPQVRKAKIRNSISPCTTGINHTSVMDKETGGQRGEADREERSC